MFSSISSINSQICCVGCRLGNLFKTLPHMEELSGASQKGWKVSNVESLLCSSLIADSCAKYCCVNFIIFATLIGITLLRVIITYDIICQWSKKFWKHMEDFPEWMWIPNSMCIDMAIPGWHIDRHGDACCTNFNLSYMEGAGRTVGRDIEATWAGTNQLAPSVQEMGPAVRHNMLNDQWNGWNFRKIVGFCAPFFALIDMCIDKVWILGSLFLKCFKQAVKMSIHQANVFDWFSATFSCVTVKKIHIWSLYLVTFLYFLVIIKFVFRLYM